MTNKRSKSPAKLTSVKLNLSFPGIGGVEGVWEADENEQEAAWEMYVELITRVALNPRESHEAPIREALSSLYSLFETTRAILREHGPVLAKPKGKGNLSFGYLSVAILNQVLRPFLGKWHPRLQHYENKRGEKGVREHEAAWEERGAFHVALQDVQTTLRGYADALAEIAGVSAIHQA
jgi:hypothetical protein